MRGTLDTPVHSIVWHGTEPSTKSVGVKLNSMGVSDCKLAQGTFQNQIDKL